MPVGQRLLSQSNSKKNDPLRPDVEKGAALVGHPNIMVRNESRLYATRKVMIFKVIRKTSV